MAKHVWHITSLPAIDVTVIYSQGFRPNLLVGFNRLHVGNLGTNHKHSRLGAITQTVCWPRACISSSLDKMWWIFVATLAKTTGMDGMRRWDRYVGTYSQTLCAKGCWASLAECISCQVIVPSCTPLNYSPNPKLALTSL